jgi:SPP1 gp7 family putative phage head morphogenesis protein
MKSEQYWSERMETLNESLLNKGETYIRRMEIEYDKARASIQKDIDVFHQRFAKNNEMGLAEARQTLNAGELKEFKWTVDDYIKAGRENAVDQRWMKELENASLRVRISRLESIKLQVRQHVEVLTGKRQKGARSLLGEIYKDGYYHSVFEVSKGTGLGATFSKLDKRQIEAVLSKPWAADGSNFSARIWQDRDKLVRELQTVLTQGFIRGDAPQKMINAISDRMGVSRSAAARLILTESAYFAGQSRIDSYRELGVEQYKFMATLDKRTSSICRGMDGKVFALSEMEVGVNYPPLHAYCRSTTIPHYEDNVKERIARDEDGKAQTVPGNMTYEEWAKENVPTVDRAPDTVQPIQPNDNAVKTAVSELEDIPNRQYNPKASYHADIPNMPPAAVDKIADINRELVREGSQTGKEYLVLADFKGDRVKWVTGSKDKVTFTSDVQDTLSKAAAGSLVLTHNHPRGNRLSVKDARTMALYAAIGVMVAAGHDGGTSTLSAPNKRSQSEFDEVLRRVTAEVDAQLQDDPAFGELSPAAKNERFDYLVLMAIVAELGWEYAEDYEAARDGNRFR